MPRLILHPTDFSEYSRMTAGLVPAVPGEKEVLLLHITEGIHAFSRPFLGGHDVTSPRESADQNLSMERSWFESRGVPVRTRVLQADGRNIEQLILSCGRKEGADLIMLGARGKGFVEGLLLGSVSSGVVRHATTDILIAHHRGSPRTSQERGDNLSSRILYPVDFSKPSLQGLDRLISMGGIGEIVLLNVIPNADTRRELDLAIRDSYAHLEDLGKGYANGRIGITLLLRFGRPAEVICDMALQERATLIVIPRFGASDFTKSLPIGSTAAEVAEKAKIPVYLMYPHIHLEVTARELEKDEFPLAAKVWQGYHQQTGDPAIDRIFGVFVEGILVAVARCRRHPDGLEVDGVFTLDDFRGRGYARVVMEPLVDACGKEVLFMHSTLPLVKFYGQFGFEKIPEDLLPHTIKERFDFAMGEMQGSNVQPMMRRADPG